MADVVDASIVFVPKFSTLVGVGEFTTLALDVSQFSGAQFQIWRGPFRYDGATEPTFEVYLEESLDTETWALGPSTPSPFTIAEDEPKLFSYGFRLRWFRLRIVISETTTSLPIVTCWAEGLLRGGGGGAWSPAAPAARGRGGAAMAGGGAATSGPSNPGLLVDLTQPVKPPAFPGREFIRGIPGAPDQDNSAILGALRGNK